MNYEKIYKQLIFNAQHRTNDDSEYYEKHHILPKCMGGSDENNIVKLTAREHYIAHLLLTKIHPNNSSLVLAFHMMMVSSNCNKYRCSRTYKFNREKHSKVMSTLQTGEKNSQFGTKWIYNNELKKSIKVKVCDVEAYLDEGWILGRRMQWNYVKCVSCGNNFIHIEYENYCSKQCYDETYEEVRIKTNNKNKNKKIYDRNKKKWKLKTELERKAQKKLEHERLTHMQNSPFYATIIYGSIIKNRDFIKSMVSDGMPVYQILQFLKMSSKSGGNYKTIEKMTQ